MLFLIYMSFLFVALLLENTWSISKLSFILTSLSKFSSALTKQNNKTGTILYIQRDSLARLDRPERGTLWIGLPRLWDKQNLCLKNNLILMLNTDIYLIFNLLGSQLILYLPNDVAT